jgi:hypothetical protein
LCQNHLISSNHCATASVFQTHTYFLKPNLPLLVAQSPVIQNLSNIIAFRNSVTFHTCRNKCVGFWYIHCERQKLKFGYLIIRSDRPFLSLWLLWF